MALLNTAGVEVSAEVYKALRYRGPVNNRTASKELPALREVLEVRTHKRAHGFSLGERAQLVGRQHGDN